MKVNYDEVFGEDSSGDELYEIRFDDFLEATNVKDELSYNSGWYNYSLLTFDYKGKRYSIEYKEHTSDNVVDMSWDFTTFVCLGEISELKKKITKEDLVRMKIQKDKEIERISNKNRDLEKENEDLLKYKNVFDKIPLSSENLAELAEVFNPKKENSNSLDKILYDLFKDISSVK